MKKQLILPFFFLLVLSSCFKKEDPLNLPTGSSEIQTLYLGADYEKEMFFDLGSKTYQEKQSDAWDLRFDASEQGFCIWLNSGNLITARKLGFHNLNEPNTANPDKILEHKELFDTPDGKVEGAALGGWQQYVDGGGKRGGIYVIELSYINTEKKYKRLQILKSDQISYTIIVADLHNDNGGQIVVGDTFIINKDKERNFSYFSFKNGGYVLDNPEPLKNSWDIQFTRYKHIFYDIFPDPFPYRVAGVLSNSYYVEIARDSSNSYSELNAASIPDLNFSKNWNVIGYDWKNHSFGAAGTYTVNPDLSYVIKDTEGKYYKLRFLDFFNPKGEKGYPKFEFERIK